MLARARQETSVVDWLEADVREWQPESPPDLIYSNATLHWVDDHPELFPRLASMLDPGGVLAVQMPLSWGMPSHYLMREVLATGAKKSRSFGTEALRISTGRKWVADADAYYDLLAGESEQLDIWETESLQILEGQDPVLEWVKGTGLRPILDGLDDQEREAYLGVYGERLREAYPMREDGKTIYPFRRLFIVATI